MAQGRFQEAVKALYSFRGQELTMNHTLRRWNMTLAEAAHGLRDKDTAAVAADTALAVLVAPDQFGRHAGVGRAVMSGKQVRRMKTLASRAALAEGNPPWLVPPVRTAAYLMVSRGAEGPFGCPRRTSSHRTQVAGLES